MNSRRFAIFAFIFLASTLAAQDLLRDHPGHWPAAPPQLKVTDSLSPAERAAASVWLAQLFDMLHHMPTLAQPVGFDILTFSRLGIQDLDRQSDSKRAKYVYGAAQVDLAAYENGPKGAFANDRNSPAQITITVNDLQPVMEGAMMGNNSDEIADDQGTFLVNPPEATGDFHGYPVYEINYDHYIVLRRNKVPFFAPVSRERYLREKIKLIDARLKKEQDDWAKNKPMIAGLSTAAEISKTMTDAIAQMQKVATDSSAELAAMSAGDRAAPAYVDLSEGDTVAPKFVAKDDGNATAILYMNPALMDDRLPRSAPQIITVDIYSQNDAWSGFGDKLQQEVDWGALEKILHANP